MHTLLLLLSASLLAAASSASAQSSPYPQPDTAPVSTVQVTAPVKSVWLRDEQARQVAGSYLMSNGWSLKVRPASRYIDAAIDSEKPMRLKAVSKSKFVSGDGNVVMEFNQSTGEDMKMSYAPDPSKPSMVSIPAQRAKR